jgi:hypothetical protein
MRRLGDACSLHCAPCLTSADHKCSCQKVAPRAAVPRGVELDRSSKVRRIIAECGIHRRQGKCPYSARRKISVNSTITRALIGKTKGMTVEVEAPGGAKVYKARRWDGLRNRGDS